MYNIKNNSNIVIESPNVRYYEDFIESDYEYENVKCKRDDKTGAIKVSYITFHKFNENYIYFYPNFLTQISF